MHYKTCAKMAFEIDEGLYRKVFGEDIECFVLKIKILLNILRM